MKAPGKLFLLGEYVVLFGGPAVVMSVARYVTVTITASDRDFEFSSPGMRFPLLKGVWEAGGMCWQDPAADHHLLITLIDALIADGVIDEHTPPFNLCIDSRDLFSDDQQKLGLGSSAAITNALVCAVDEYAHQCTSVGNASRVAPEFVYGVHQAFQEGRGSGADIAAGVIGGVSIFQRLPNGVLPKVEAISLPEDLYICPIWVGKSASTQSALRALERFQLEHPGQFSQAITPLLVLAESGIEALKSSDSAGFARLCGQYCHNLSDFGRIVGVDIVSTVHQEVLALARQTGVAYKPSGAGSGDFGIALSNNIKALDHFERAVTRAGFTPMKMGLGRPCERII